MANAAPKLKTSDDTIKTFHGKILDWYDREHRKLPWRAAPGQLQEPYKVWLSEIMLQQTVVNAVVPYFLRFLALWPKVEDLAAAPSEDVMREWAGLGYYARARNLHKCAKVVAGEMGGVFPKTQAALKKLPGVGDYTSAAIAAIAFGERATVVDGNIERVMARLFAVQGTLPDIKPELKKLAAPFFEGAERPGDLAQALMDLGAGICTPKSPKCMLCPVTEFCEGRALGIAEELPRKKEKGAKPRREGTVYWIEDGAGNVLLHRRPEKGMLGGMTGFPTSGWSKSHESFAAPPELKPYKEKVLHSFTHFDLTLILQSGVAKEEFGGDYFWHPVENLNSVGFPTLFKKVLRLKNF